MCNANCLGPDVKIRLKWFQQQNFLRRKIILSVGWIWRARCFLNSYQGIKWSIRKCIIGNWAIWTHLSSKKAQNSLPGKDFWSTKAMRNQTHIRWSVKNYCILKRICCLILLSKFLPLLPGKTCPPTNGDVWRPPEDVKRLSNKTNWPKVQRALSSFSL